MKERHKMSDEERHTVVSQRLLDCFTVLRDAGDDMPLSMLVAYLAVARHPGITLSKLAEACEMPYTTVARSVSILARWGRKNREPANLVRTDENPENRREKVVFLTAKGERVLEILSMIVLGEGAQE